MIMENTDAISLCSPTSWLENIGMASQAGEDNRIRFIITLTKMLLEWSPPVVPACVTGTPDKLPLERWVITSAPDIKPDIL